RNAGGGVERQGIGTVVAEVRVQDASAPFPQSADEETLQRELPMQQAPRQGGEYLCSSGSRRREDAGQRKLGGVLEHGGQNDGAVATLMEKRLVHEGVGSREM